MIAHGERAAADVERLGAVDVERRQARRRTKPRCSRRSPATPRRSRPVGGTSARRSRGASARRSRRSASRPTSSRSRWAGDRPGRTSPRSRSTAMRSRSTRPASTRSSSGSPRTPASPPGRSAGSPRAGSSAGSRWRSRRSSPRPTRRPTLVFDEIDTGIGGRSADPVGRSLWTLGRRHQVLCVTHLPQIAAHADAHFQIEKRERDGRTITEVHRLDRDGRVAELAQMLAGGRGRRRRRGRRARAPRSCRGVASGVGCRRLTWPTPRRPRSSGRSPGTSTTSRWSAACRRPRSRPIARTSTRSPAIRGTDRTGRPGRTSRPLPGLARGGTRAGATRPRLAGTSRRRRTAALRGFYRFAFGEGLIGVDVAAHIDLPRETRHLPETLSVEEVERLLDGRRRTAATADREPARRPAAHPRPGPARAALRGRPPDQRGAPPGRRGPLARRRLRPGHRQGRPRAPRAGRRRGAGLAPALRRCRAAGLAGDRPRGAGPRRPGLPHRAWPAARTPAGLVDRQARGRGGRPRRAGVARTPSGTRSRPISWRAEPTCASFRSCSDMRPSARRSCTPT